VSVLWMSLDKCKMPSITGVQTNDWTPGF